MRDNQDNGFSLVELIVVVAIMAVLVGILVPAYLAYVEKTRIQRDESAAGEIFRAAEIVVYTGTYDVTGMVVVQFSSSGVTINSAIANQDEIEDLLKEHFGSNLQSIVPVSKKYKNKTYSITMLPPDEGATMPKLSGAWS